MTFSITNDQADWLSRATKAIERIADEFYPRLKKAWDSRTTQSPEAIASEINNVPASWAAAALERNDERAFLALMNRVTAIDSSVLQRMKTSVETYGITSPWVIAAIEYVELGMIAFSDGNQSSREVTPLKRRAIF